jgi:hypothetical protein
MQWLASNQPCNTFCADWSSFGMSERAESLN